MSAKALWPMGRHEYVAWLNKHLNPPILVYRYALLENGAKPTPVIEKHLRDVLDGERYQKLIR